MRRIRAALLSLCAAAGMTGPASAQINLFGPTGPSSMAVVSYRDLPFRTVVRQRFDFSCGSAALATLLRYHYKRDVSEREVFEAMYADGPQEQIRRVGFSLLDMKRYLAGHGLRGDGYRMTLEALAARGSPAVVLVNHEGYRHFVVFKGYDESRVLIGDPALGLKIYSQEAFLSMWNGVAFIIDASAGEFNQADEWRPNPGAPFDVLPSSSLAAMTQQLPPLYQITTRFSLDGVLR